MPDLSPETRRKVFALLGLAHRAGKLALGWSAVETGVHRGLKPLLLVAGDVGAAQRRKIMSLQPVAGVIVDFADKSGLGRALGREELAVVAVEDRNFIKGIRDAVAEANEAPRESGK